jgi:hypothetical protein
MEFNIADSKKYIIAYHGSSPNCYYDTNYFIVPDNTMIVFFTNEGVLSSGSNTIPFLLNLKKYCNDLFNYVFDPKYYECNLDKNNVNSYRHCDFYESLPFFSSANYFNNFEIYPPGSKCSDLWFHTTSQNEYFTGVANLDNLILSPDNKISLKDKKNITRQHEFLRSVDEDGWNTLLLCNRNKFFNTRERCIYFISTCRIQNINEINGYKPEFNLIIHNEKLGCNNLINYNLDEIKEYLTEQTEYLKTEYFKTEYFKPENKNAIDNAILQLTQKNTKYIEIRTEMISKYRQEHIFYQRSHFAKTLYDILFSQKDANIMINSKALVINGGKDIASKIDLLTGGFINFSKKYNKINLQNKLLRIRRTIEALKKFLQFITDETTFIIIYNKIFEISEIYNEYNFVEEKKTYDNLFSEDIEEYKKIYNKIDEKTRKRNRERQKYLKYKQKYLELKKNISAKNNKYY